MGTILVSATINRAQITLLDDVSMSTGGEITWNATDPNELLKFYNASVRLVCIYKPDVSVYTGDQSLVAGPRQTVPGHQFIALKSNADGLAMRQMDMDDLDHLIPTWRAATPAPTRIWAADKKQTTVFWVYPPAAANAIVESVYATTPPEVTAVSVNPLDDVYEQCLYWLLLAHAYAKRTLRGDLSKTSLYLNLASQALGVKDQMQLREAPLPAAQEQRAN